MGVHRAGSATANVTQTATNGFTDPVNYTISGLPPGVTASFSPSTIAGSGSSTLTLNAAAATTPGAYTATVTGTDSISGATQTATIILSIDSGPAFSLSLAPATLQVQSSQSVPANITVAAASGFDDPVTLCVGGVPAGVTDAFYSAGLVGPGTSTMVLSISSNSPPGISTLIVTGTDSATGASQTASLTLSVLPAAVPNGVYTLTNSWNSLLLTDPSASTTSGTQMIQSTATGGTEQQWQFVFQPSGYYTIQNAASQLYLTDPGSSNTPGIDLEQIVATNDDSQLWSLAPSSTGVLITNKATGLAVDDDGQSLTSGTGMILWAASGAANQIWTLSGKTTALPNGIYTLTNGSSGLVLADPAASTSSGAQIIQWAASGGQEQFWDFVLQPSGYYTIQNVVSQLFLADPSSKRSSNARSPSLPTHRS